MFVKIISAQKIICCPGHIIGKLQIGINDSHQISDATDWATSILKIIPLLLLWYSIIATRESLAFSLIQKIPNKYCKIILFSERFSPWLFSMEFLRLLIKTRQFGLVTCTERPQYSCRMNTVDSENPRAMAPPPRLLAMWPNRPLHLSSFSWFI